MGLTSAWSQITASPCWLDGTENSPFGGQNLPRREVSLSAWLLALSWAVLLQGAAGEAQMEQGPWRDALGHGPALLPWGGGVPRPP